MSYILKIRILFVSILLALVTGCSNEPMSIYEGIPEEGDGVISVDIGDETEEIDPIIEEPQQKLNLLSETEEELIDDLHNGEKDKLSFLVVDVETSKIMRSYYAEEPRRLASVSKIPTALAALEEVNNVSVSKVSSMLKSSNNGEASRYVRLAARAIDGYVTQGSAYTSGCPSAFRNDTPAAKIVENWVFNTVPSSDWMEASLNDGAGCHYDIFMTCMHVARIIEGAES
ncbi:MAG: hypothetical protein HRT44_13690 [Bdellovibrionales bacterium]|nr:hypothetical protein [Bdellovibrionales bacterium]NQZ20290.1 hypothetical protein [Bdellovibrionales bacterium]